MKLVALFIFLFAAMLATWTLIDWQYVRTPPPERTSGGDWLLLVLAIYPTIAAIAVARAMKSRKVGWRILVGMVTFIAFAITSVAALLTIGLEIHFWLGGSL